MEGQIGLIELQYIQLCSEVMPVSGRPILSWAPFSGASVITAHIKRKAMQRSRVLNIVIKAMIIKNFYL